MAPQEIRKHHVRKPFIPFRIVMDDGTTFLIDDPSTVGVDLLAVYVGVDPDESGLPRRSIWLSPSHISRIEPLPDGSVTDEGRSVSSNL